MNKCPDQSCRDNVTRLGTFFKVFGGSIGVIVSVILGLSIYGLGAEKRQNDKIAEQDKRGEIRSVKQDTIILNQTLFRIEIEKLRQEREEDRKQSQKDKQDILDAIRDGIGK